MDAPQTTGTLGGGGVMGGSHVGTETTVLTPGLVQEFLCPRGKGDSSWDIH